MSKHTPGPWVAVPLNVRMIGSAKPPMFKTGLWQVFPENDLYRLAICVVDRADDHDETTRDSAEHDAKLIASAPELLDALIVARRELHACQAVIHLSGGFDPAYVNGAQYAIKQADVAIKKCTGENI